MILLQIERNTISYADDRYKRATDELIMHTYYLLSLRILY